MDAAAFDFAAIPLSPGGVVSFASKWFATSSTRSVDCITLEDGESEELRRAAKLSHWIERREVEYESSALRTAISCFDALHNFLSAAVIPEKAFFSAHLRISQGDRQTTDYGYSLSLKSVDAEEAAFQNVCAFLKGISNLGIILEKDYEKQKCTIVVDANICGTPGYPRKTVDTESIIRVTEAAIHILFEISHVDPISEPVRVIPHVATTIPPHTTSLAFITADWEENGPDSVHLIRNVRRAACDMSASLDHLLESLPDPESSAQRKNIILLGNTGSGKSHSGNWILNEFVERGMNVGPDRFVESQSGSMTSFVDSLPRNENFGWRVLDTPGLNDSYGRDDKFIYDLEMSLFELGCVHAVVLCIASLERIDDSIKKSLRVYTRIIGGSLSKKLVILVNRSPRAVTQLQIRALMNEIRNNCGAAVEKSQIFDVSPRRAVDDVIHKKRDAFSLISKLADAGPIDVGRKMDLMSSIQEIRSLKEDEEQKEKAKDELLKRSSEALRQVLNKRRDNKFCLKVQPSLGTSIILSDGVKREMKDGIERVIEYHLEMPQHIRERFDRRFKLFARCLFMWQRKDDIDETVETVRSMRLVYRKLPSERAEDRRNGILRQVYKVHLHLWSIDDALLDDVKYKLNRMFGNNEEQREVTYFDRGQSSVG